MATWTRSAAVVGLWTGLWMGLWMGLSSAIGCGDEAGPTPGLAPAAGDEPALGYAAEVISFTPGAGAGFGQGAMPDVVLGPPTGAGSTVGGLDVVALGEGGEIVLGFGSQAIVDGEGPDLVIFENPFFTSGGGDIYAEPGEVSLSEDGEIWHTFPCDPAPTDADGYPGCAGWRPVMPYDPAAVAPIDPALTGGDPFDLADLGMARARFVRIRDVSQQPAAFPPSKGFDLDAVGIIHAEIE